MFSDRVPMCDDRLDDAPPQKTDAPTGTAICPLTSKSKKSSPCPPLSAWSAGEDKTIPQTPNAKKSLHTWIMPFTVYVAYLKLLNGDPRYMPQ